MSNFRKYFSVFKHLIAIAAVGTLPISWVVHVVSCLLTGKYILLLVGAILFPVGMLHGYGIMFGINW